LSALTLSNVLVTFRTLTDASGRALISIVFGGNDTSPATRAASAGARSHRRAVTAPSADTSESYRLSRRA
jgi:hypothetical protein